MPLFTGVPFIVQTPEERRKTNLMAAAQAQTEAKDLFELREKRRQFDEMLPLRKLQEEAAIVGMKNAAMQRDIALREAEFTLNQYNKQLEEAPVLLEWSQQARTAKTLEDLPAPPLGQLTGDNYKNAIDLYSNIRQAFTSRESARLRQAQITSLEERSNQLMAWRESQPKSVQAQFDQEALALRQSLLQFDVWTPMEERLSAYQTYQSMLQDLVDRTWGTTGQTDSRFPPAINQSDITIPRQPEESTGSLFDRLQKYKK